MKRHLMAVLSLIFLVSFISSAFVVSAESAVTQSGEAKMVESAFPVIDGQVDEVWENTNSYYLDIIKVGEDSGVKGYFKLLWTPTTLYGLLVAPDKTPNHEAENDYQRDTAEISIDLSNARTEAYENDDQMNLRFYANGDEMLVARDGNGMVSLDNVDWAVGISADGYTCEFAVKCNTLGVTLSADKIIGFDAQINDNAEGFGDRAACYAWNDDADAVYSNPTYMGEIKLVSASADPAPAVVEEPAAAPAADAAPAAAAPAPAPVAAAPAPAAPATSDFAVLPILLIALSAVAFSVVRKLRRATR